ncbi:MAG: TlpA family protein disulfide reductase [Candidatus Omnitrophica bacterium]|nr:TlpA family protein disulfide reductase [Candidatus Omnitrophota bacterium]
MVTPTPIVKEELAINRRSLWGYLLVFLLLPSFLFAAAPFKTERGRTADDFTLLDLEKNKVSLSDFKGKPVILMFWTTSCPFCRSELKLLNSKIERFAKQGVELLTIDAGEPLYRAQNFMQRYGFSLRVLLDEDTQVAFDYGILGVPTYIFIDRNGKIVAERNSFSEKAYSQILAD